MNKYHNGKERGRDEVESEETSQSSIVNGEPSPEPMD